MVIMVRLLQDSNEKTYKMPSREADSRQIVNAAHYYHFRCIHKGKNKIRYIFQPQIFKNTCNINRNKCIPISVNVYCYIFLSSSSYSCYEESLPTHKESLLGWGISCLLLTSEVNIWPRVGQTKISLPRPHLQWLIQRWACDPSLANQGLFCHSNKKKPFVGVNWWVSWVWGCQQFLLFIEK